MLSFVIIYRNVISLMSFPWTLYFILIAALVIVVPLIFYLTYLFSYLRTLLVDLITVLGNCPCMYKL